MTSDIAPARHCPAFLHHDDRATQSEMEASRFDTLTERQRDCLRLLASPMQQKEIAQELTLSPRTVENYLAEAARRLGAGSTREAARMLVEPERVLEGKSPWEKARMEPPPPRPAELVSPADIAPVRRGRIIVLGAWERLAITAGLTILLIFSMFILAAGGERIALEINRLRSERPVPTTSQTPRPQQHRVVAASR